MGKKLKNLISLLDNQSLEKDFHFFHGGTPHSSKIHKTGEIWMIWKQLEVLLQLERKKRPGSGPSEVADPRTDIRLAIDPTGLRNLLLKRHHSAKNFTSLAPSGKFLSNHPPTIITPNHLTVVSAVRQYLCHMLLPTKIMTSVIIILSSMLGSMFNIQ